MCTRSIALNLRRIDAVEQLQHRLRRSYAAQCTLADGAAELLIREDACPTSGHVHGLPLSTRFGPAIAHDYGALLLACTGVDVTQATTAAAQAAFARYGFAALEPSLQAALGDPTVRETAAAALEREPTFAINLLLRLPSIRLTMRLLMTAAGVHALLDSGPWQPPAPPTTWPAWLASVDAALALIVGESTLALAECDGLASGDIIRFSSCSFDVTGRATVRIASHDLRLRWLDSHRCFEVEDMTQASTLSADHYTDQADTATVTASPTAAIDTAGIPIRLSFSLGTLRLTVADVAALRRGSLLELARGLPPEVTIEANGLPIGTGELVDLNGRLAVEITQWPPERAAAPAS